MSPQVPAEQVDVAQDVIISEPEGLRLVDLSLSAVARGKIMVAAREGQAIPEGWAIDAAGRPTTCCSPARPGSARPPWP